MADSLTSELAELRTRVERCEAIEACRCRFNEYLYYLDGGHLDELIDLFADDARLELMNFPPGSGSDLNYDGRDEIRKLYTAFVGEGARHHSANVSIVLSETGDRAEVIAYDGTEERQPTNSMTTTELCQLQRVRADLRRHQ